MRVTIRNFKSVGQASIELRPGLNILIGPNGSGKTCLLSALQFVRDVFRVGAAQALALQGGAQQAYRHGKSVMSFSLTHPYGNRTYRRRKAPCELRWEVEIGRKGPEKLATITREEIRVTAQIGETRVCLFAMGRSTAHGRPKVTLASPQTFGRDLFSVWRQEFGGTSKAALAGLFEKKWIRPRLYRLREEPDHSFVPMLAGLDTVLDHVQTSFRFLNEYSILPDVARASTEQLPFAQMAPNGHGVSEVIDALEKRRYDKLAFAEAEEAYGLGYLYPRRLPYWLPFGRHLKPYGTRLDAPYAFAEINRELAAAVKPITRVSVDIDPTNGKRFVVFKAGRDTFYPQEVSDGTIKWLCILVSLFVPFSRVYLLEEPENFLHPWMQQRLISIMRRQAEQNKTIFFLASHSATILNAAFPEEILTVKQGKQGTDVSAMTDLQSVKKVLAESKFHLGDLWVSGAIGAVPAHE
jgi:predicted ATPase